MQSRLPPVRLENFEGPFDLLIELARSKKIDLSEVSLRSLTDAFLEYLREVKLTPEVLGDFLVVAATLLLLKVRHIHPQLADEEREEVRDFGERIRAYQFYRERALWIRTVWRRYLLLSAGAFAPTRTITFSGELDIDPQTLAQLWQSVLRRRTRPIEKREHLRRQGRTLSECLALLQKRLAAWETLVLQHVMRPLERREAAVTFLAVLELARQNEVQLSQTSSFGDLIVERNG